MVRAGGRGADVLGAQAFQLGKEGGGGVGDLHEPLGRRVLAFGVACDEAVSRWGGARVEGGWVQGRTTA